MDIKEKLAETKKQQEITKKVFSNSVIADSDGNPIKSVTLGGKYLLYSKESNKKVGWIRLASRPGEASVGWVNLPDYMKMEEPKEIPDEFKGQEWDTVDFEEYGIKPDSPEVEAEANGYSKNTEDVARYVSRLGALLQANIKGRIDDKEYDRRMEVYIDDCDYENVQDVVDKLNEYTAYEHLVYRQQNTAFDPTRSTADLHEFTYVNEQAKKAMDRVRSDFEAAHPDLDFDMLADYMSHAKYPDRHFKEMPGYGTSFSEDNAVDRFCYVADYWLMASDFSLAKRRDLDPDNGLSPQQWKENRRNMNFNYTACKFIEMDYHLQYDSQVYEDEKAFKLSSGPAGSIEQMSDRIDEWHASMNEPKIDQNATFDY